MPLTAEEKRIRDNLILEAVQKTSNEIVESVLFPKLAQIAASRGVSNPFDTTGKAVTWLLKILRTGYYFRRVRKVAGYFLHDDEIWSGIEI